VEPRRVGRLAVAGLLARVEAGAIGQGGDTCDGAEGEAVLGLPAFPTSVRAGRFGRERGRY
jgi:hypothetical protein